MMAVKQVQMGTLMRDVLGESYISLELRGVEYEDDITAGRASLVAVVVEKRTGVERRVSGEGVGLVSVAFNALVETFVDEYPSLANLRFHSFSLEGAAETEQGSPGIDSQKTAHFAVDNQVGYTFRFTATSRSIRTSCLQVTLAAVEYFVNSELSFFRVRGFLDEAKVKNRPDLVERYTQMLTQIVMNSLYSGSIEK